MWVRVWLRVWAPVFSVWVRAFGCMGVGACVVHVCVCEVGVCVRVLVRACV